MLHLTEQVLPTQLQILQGLLHGASNLNDYKHSDYRPKKEKTQLPPTNLAHTCAALLIGRNQTVFTDYEGHLFIRLKRDKSVTVQVLTKQFATAQWSVVICPLLLTAAPSASRRSSWKIPAVPDTDAFYAQEVRARFCDSPRPRRHVKAPAATSGS
jgi:hypothetical protein